MENNDSVFVFSRAYSVSWLAGSVYIKVIAWKWQLVFQLIMATKKLPLNWSAGQGISLISNDTTRYKLVYSKNSSYQCL